MVKTRIVAGSGGAPEKKPDYRSMAHDEILQLKEIELADAFIARLPAVEDIPLKDDSVEAEIERAGHRSGLMTNNIDYRNEKIREAEDNFNSWGGWPKKSFLQCPDYGWGDYQRLIKSAPPARPVGERLPEPSGVDGWGRLLKAVTKCGRHDNKMARSDILWHRGYYRQYLELHEAKPCLTSLVAYCRLGEYAKAASLQWGASPYGTPPLTDIVRADVLAKGGNLPRAKKKLMSQRRSWVDDLTKFVKGYDTRLESNNYAFPPPYSGICYDLLDCLHLKDTPHYQTFERISILKDEDKGLYTQRPPHDPTVVREREAEEERKRIQKEEDDWIY